MNLREIENTVFAVAKLRVPRFVFDPKEPMNSTRPGIKVEQLESFLLDAAYGRADAEEARLFAYEAVRRLKNEWDHLDGWQINFGTPEKAARATQPQVAEAKRQISPELYDSIEKGNHLIRRLSEQIKRLEKDEEVASRVYTLISGG